MERPPDQPLDQPPRDGVFPEGLGYEPVAKRAAPVPRSPASVPTSHGATPEKGHWVTIHGHKTFIDDEGLFHFGGPKQPGIKPDDPSFHEKVGASLARQPVDPAHQRMRVRAQLSSVGGMRGSDPSAPSGVIRTRTGSRTFALQHSGLDRNAPQATVERIPSGSSAHRVSVGYRNTNEDVASAGPLDNVVREQDVSGTHAQAMAQAMAGLVGEHARMMAQYAAHHVATVRSDALRRATGIMGHVSRGLAGIGRRYGMTNAGEHGTAGSTIRWLEAYDQRAAGSPEGSRPDLPAGQSQVPVHLLGPVRRMVRVDGLDWPETVVPAELTEQNAVANARFTHVRGDANPHARVGEDPTARPSAFRVAGRPLPDHRSVMQHTDPGTGLVVSTYFSTRPLPTNHVESQGRPTAEAVVQVTHNGSLASRMTIQNATVEEAQAAGGRMANWASAHLRAGPAKDGEQWGAYDPMADHRELQGHRADPIWPTSIDREAVRDQPDTLVNSGSTHVTDGALVDNFRVGGVPLPRGRGVVGMFDRMSGIHVTGYFTHPTTATAGKDGTTRTGPFSVIAVSDVGQLLTTMTSQGTDGDVWDAATRMANWAREYANDRPPPSRHPSVMANWAREYANDRPPPSRHPSVPSVSSPSPEPDEDDPDPGADMEPADVPLTPEDQAVLGARDKVTADNCNDRFTVSIELGTAVTRRHAEHTIFGRSLHPSEYGQLVGAIDGAHVKVSFVGLGHLRGRPDSTVKDERPWIRIKTSHPWYGNERTITWKDQDLMNAMIPGTGTPAYDGGAYGCYNDIFRTNETQLPGNAPPPQGLGARVLAMQIRKMRSMGMAFLHTTAAGNKETSEEPGGFAGYTVWPKLAYNATFTSWMRSTARKKATANPSRIAQTREPAGLDQMTDLAAVHATAEGAKWWREYGGITSMFFDIRPDSLQMPRLDLYLAGARNGTTGKDGKPAKGISLGLFPRDPVRRSTPVADPPKADGLPGVPGFPGQPGATANPKPGATPVPDPGKRRPPTDV